MIKAGLIAATALLCATDYANADWFYKGEASAFGGAGNQIVYTSNRNYGLALRCDEGSVATIYMTPEEGTQKQYEDVGATGTLMVKIDDLAPLTADATPDVADGHVRVTAQFNDDLLNQIKGAKRKVSVAIKIGEQIFHESTFEAQGAAKALGKFINACPAASGAKG